MIKKQKLTSISHVGMSAYLCELSLPLFRLLPDSALSRVLAPSPLIRLLSCLSWSLHRRPSVGTAWTRMDVVTISEAWMVSGPWLGHETREGVKHSQQNCQMKCTCHISPHTNIHPCMGVTRGVTFAQAAGRS
jgi:hypothetical protein